LGTDQSWLSHKIRQLEASLGVNLFIRSTRSVELTRAGLTLLEPARRLAEVAEQARQATDILHRGMSGTVRVGALPFSFPDRHRTSLLDGFMTEHADVQVVVLNGPTPVLIDHVRSGKVDLAFVSGPLDEAGLDVLLLRENSYCLLMAEDHPLAAASKITEEVLKGERIVLAAQHFSPAAYNSHYRPVVEAGAIAVPVPEFQCSVSYAARWNLPVMCTTLAAERHMDPCKVIRPLDFVPPCKKYLVRLSDYRTPSQTLMWERAEAAIRSPSPE
jgi:DNA-binding transcriptional LysR family regulator